jgi:rubrerythrin
MKKLIYSIIFIAVLAGMTSCTAPDPVKSKEDLKAAFNGESTASAKYAKYAQKAWQDSLSNIAVLFEAASRAEGIHADNHKKVLEKLRVKVEGPEIGAFEVKTTAENLADAIKGESYEVATMYPDFIKDAETEKVKDAIKSFTWAYDTEKKHKAFYEKALAELNAGNQSNLPTRWFVCPVCGNTYDLASVKNACDFCKTKKEKFIMFMNF